MTRILVSWLLIFLPGSVTASESVSALDFTRSSATEVATVLNVWEGKRCHPVILIEELHSSRAIAIEIAIVLNRLYRDTGLRTIGLEGYLLDQTPIDTAWFDAAAGRDSRRRAKVATQLLAEGEISSAEFLALTYPDVSVKPIDRRENYPPDPSPRAHVMPRTFLVYIAEQNANESTREVRRALEVAIRHFQSNEENWDAATREEERAKIAEMLSGYYELLMPLHPWAEKRYEQLDPAARGFRLGERVKALNEIEQRANRDRIHLSGRERDGLNEALAWWRGRHRASETMVDELETLCVSAAAPIASTIGAAHTLDMYEYLKARGISVAALSPVSYQRWVNEEADIVDLSNLMYTRKSSQRSVFTEGLAVTLDALFPSQLKKPQPVLNQQWFQAKAELYLITDRIAQIALGGSGSGAPPRDGSVVPSDFFDEDGLNGQWVSIDRRRIQYVSPSRREERVFGVTEHNLRRLEAAGVTAPVREQLTKLQGRQYAGETALPQCDRNRPGCDAWRQPTRYAC